MKKLIRVLYLLPCMASLLLSAFSAHADITNATVYLNTPDATNAGDPANFASTLANASFSIGASGVNFYTNDSPSTPIATFLNNPTFTSMQNGFNPNTSTNNSELVLVGSVYLNAGTNSFVVAHDDGVVLDIPGIGYTDSSPGPTGLITTPFSVDNPNAAGLYSFNLDYSECCGGPAGLIFTVNGAPISQTPEPGSMVLLGTGVLALANTIRRRRLASVQPEL